VVLVPEGQTLYGWGTAGVLVVRIHVVSGHKSIYFYVYYRSTWYCRYFDTVKERPEQAHTWHSISPGTHPWSPQDNERYLYVNSRRSRVLLLFWTQYYCSTSTVVVVLTEQYRICSLSKEPFFCPTTHAYAHVRRRIYQVLYITHNGIWVILICTVPIPGTVKYWSTFDVQ
jgi:hypothetical protein